MCLLLGGPTYKLPIRGKLVPIEWHQYCGPWPVHRVTGSPLEHEPPGFWDAVQLWIDGGKRLDGDLCIVPEQCWTCKGSGDEVKHLGGKHWEIVGRCKTCDGAKVVFAGPGGGR